MGDATCCFLRRTTCFLSKSGLKMQARITFISLVILYSSEAIKKCYQVPENPLAPVSLPQEPIPAPVPDAKPDDAFLHHEPTQPAPQPETPKDASTTAPGQDQTNPDPTTADPNLHPDPDQPVSQPETPKDSFTTPPVPVPSEPKTYENPPPSGAGLGASAGGATAADNNAYLAEVGLAIGDLPRCDGSGHLDQGLPLNTDKLNAIFDFVGLPPIREAVNRLTGTNAYNQGQSPSQKVQGAYLAWSTAAKLQILRPTDSQDDNELKYGSLKRAGMANNAGEVDKILTAKGANKFGIPADLMAYLWGTNEHQYVFCSIFTNH